MYDDIRQNPDILRSIPLFLPLTDEQALKVLQHEENEIIEYGPRDIVCTQGDVGFCMYIILQGTVEIIVSGIEGRDVTVATLQEKDSFGEQALLPGNPSIRNATARALHGAIILTIRKDDVLYSLDRDPQSASRLSSSSVEQQVENLLKGIRLFHSLEENDYYHLNEWAEVIEYGPGEIIVKEQDIGDYLYVVMSGTAEVFLIDDDGRIIVLHTLKQGNFFGEQALLPGSDGHRNANVRTDDPCTLVKVHKEKFRIILSQDKKLMPALQLVGNAQRERIKKYLLA